MPTGPNPILASDNTQLPVTNLAIAGGSSAAPISVPSGIPLTTADGTATGQVVVATRAVGSGSAGAAQVQGLAANNAAAVGNPVYIAGLAVTAASYAPAFTDGDAAALAIDITSGGLLCHIRELETTTDEVGTLPIKSTNDLTGAAINFAASGDNTIVAAVASQTTKVYRMYFTVAGATALTIKDGAGTSLTGAMTFATGGGFVFEFAERPWWTTSANTAFIINSSAAVQVSGRVEYITSA